MRNVGSRAVVGSGEGQTRYAEPPAVNGFVRHGGPFAISTWGAQGARGDAQGGRWRATVPSRREAVDTALFYKRRARYIKSARPRVSPVRHA